MRGIWGASANRIIEELEDHYEASVWELRKEGVNESLLEERSLLALGNPQQIAKVAAAELHPILQLFKGTLLVVVTIMILLTAFPIWLRWSGDHDWKKAQAELSAKGEKLTVAELVPPTLPDDQNFFADPLWAEYEDLVLKKNDRGTDAWVPRVAPDKSQLQHWKYTPLSPEEQDRFHALMPAEILTKERMFAISALRTQIHQEKNLQKQKEEAALLLSVLSPSEPVLKRIEQLSERPYACFPIRYDLGPRAPLPHLSPLLMLSQTLESKVLSELILGNNIEASADTLTLLRITFIQKNELPLISFLVRVSSVSLALQAINEGILRHAWTESNLINFQEILERINLQEAFLNALKGERAFFNQFELSHFTSEMNSKSVPSNLLERIKSELYPFFLSTIFLTDKTYHNLWVQRTIEYLNSKILSGWNVDSMQLMDQDTRELAGDPIKRSIYALNLMVCPAISGSIQKTSEIQTQVEQTILACALERYYFDHKSYPQSLNLLVSKFLSKLPNSPINGKPMNYSLQSDGSFLLWTSGWKLKSLGGKSVEFKGDGDIVWNQTIGHKVRSY